MNSARIMGILLLVAGSMSLIYGGFTYDDVHRGEIGSLKVSVTEKDRVNIPVWAGGAALVAGGLLLGFSARKSA